MRPKQDAADTLKPISDHETYPIKPFMQHVGWGRHALQQARRRGLRVVKVSGRCFIRGADFSQFLANVASDSEAAQ